MVDKTDIFTILPGGGFLVLSIETLDKMKQYTQHFETDFEAGGVIIGSLRQKKEELFLLSSPPHIEITDVSEPGLDDTRTRFSFVRKSKHHVELVKVAKANSNNDIDYLGEWHTHPEAKPTPSSIDIYHWKRNLNGRHAVLIIIGIESTWVGYWDGRKAIQLPKLKLDCFEIVEASADF